MSSGSTTLIRRVGTDANDTNVILVRQVDRVAASLQLVYGFLLGLNVVVVVCGFLGVVLPEETSSGILWLFDILICGLGIAVGALGVFTMHSASSVHPSESTRLLYSTAAFSGLFTLYIAIRAAVKFTSLAEYLQNQYHFSEISSMTAISLSIVTLAYVMAYISLKTYIFHRLISELKNVDPRARFAATLGKILDR